jgi:hypothetical protein
MIFVIFENALTFLLVSDSLVIFILDLKMSEYKIVNAYKFILYSLTVCFF